MNQNHEITLPLIHKIYHSLLKQSAASVTSFKKKMMQLDDDVILSLYSVRWVSWFQHHLHCIVSKTTDLGIRDYPALTITLLAVHTYLCGPQSFSVCYHGGSFFLACDDFGRRFNHSFSACVCFFEVEIISRTLIPLIRPGSVHSGSVCWDDWLNVPWQVAYKLISW